METKDLIYKNGHFYDRTTQKRVRLTDGAQISITAAPEHFLPFSPAGAWPLKILSHMDKLNLLLNEVKPSKHKKIAGQGAFLYFSINRHSKTKEIINHEFKVELLEDLYLFLKSDWKTQEEKLYDCACVVRENTTKTIDFFEPVYAESLNEVYKYTFVHYFGNDGNPACNAIDRFYEEERNEKSTLRRFRDN